MSFGRGVGILGISLMAAQPGFTQEKECEISSPVQAQIHEIIELGCRSYHDLMSGVVATRILTVGDIETVIACKRSHIDATNILETHLQDSNQLPCEGFVSGEHQKHIQAYIDMLEGQKLRAPDYVAQSGD